MVIDPERSRRWNLGVSTAVLLVGGVVVLASGAPTIDIEVQRDELAPLVASVAGSVAEFDPIDEVIVSSGIEEQALSACTAGGSYYVQRWSALTEMPAADALEAFRTMMAEQGIAVTVTTDTTQQGMYEQRSVPSAVGRTDHGGVVRATIQKLADDTGDESPAQQGYEDLQELEITMNTGCA